MNDIIRKRIYVLVCLLFAFGFLFFLGENGPILAADSKTFMNPSPYIKSAYPLYTSFLTLCSNIWGEDRYLYAVYVIQSGFAFFTSWILAEYIRKYFNLNYIYAFVVYACIYLPYGYSLPENVVSHHILTEGLAFPLFSLYMFGVLKCFLENKKRYLVGAGFIVILLFLTRSQLMLLIPVYLILWGIYFLCNICKKINMKQRKTILGVLIIFFVVCGGTAFLSLGKIVELSGWGQLTDAVMGRVLCAIDEEDRVLFQEDEQEVFDLLYEAVENKGYRYPHFREGVWKWEDILDATNENTKMYRYVVYDYYLEKGIGNAEEEAMNCISSMVSTLYRHHWGDYLVFLGHLFLQSFVVAIFIHPTKIFTLCYIIAILIYIITIVALLYANRKMKIEKKYSIPLLLTLLMIVSLVVITNVVFYGVQRYVVYAFGSFYMSWLILMFGMYKQKRKDLRGV